MAKMAPTKMFRLRYVAALAVFALSAASSGPAAAQEQSQPGGFDQDQVQGIEQIIRNYLMKNPEVLIESLSTYQMRQKMAQEQRRKQVLAESSAALTQDPDAPVMGNPDGDVAIVEFFDYRCPYCRRVADTLKRAVEQDGNIRLIMKEFPILGPESVQAARAALAAVLQDKYEAFHWALMTLPGDMSDAHIMQTARIVGLDVDRLRKDMRSREIDAMIRRNTELARTLDINGTPAFVIGGTLVPGAIDMPTIERLIAEARAESS